MERAERPGGVTGRLEELDGVRGVAVLLIVLLHYVPALDPAWLPVGIVDLLRPSFLGVDLFFVLSGFLIGGIVYRRVGTRNFARVFYLRRAARILPLYLVLIGTGILGRMLVEGSPGAHWHRLFHDDLPTWSYLTFTQNLLPALLPGTQAGSTWMTVTWSLAVEEHFYLAAPLLALFASRRALTVGAVVLLFASPVLRALALMLDAQAMHLYTMTPFRADALAVGVLLSAHAQGELALPVRALGFLRERLGWILLATWTWLAIDNPMRNDASVLTHCLSYSVLALLLGAVIDSAQDPGSPWQRVLRARPLRIAGIWAYGIYLTHVPMLWLVHGLMLASEPSLDGAQACATTAIAALLTLAFAAASWRWVESPLLRAGQRHAYEPGT